MTAFSNWLRSFVPPPLTVSKREIFYSCLGALIDLMFVLRCLHPPSGAVAITAVMGGPAIHALGYQFVIFPVFVNSLFLLILALVFNNALRHRYPHQVAKPARTTDPLPSARLGFTSQDLDQALSDFGELLDINKSDLADLINQAKVNSFQRQFGGCIV